MARPGLVERITRVVPRPAIDFLYRNRFHPLLRPGRRVLLRGLGDPRQGRRITRGPLAGRTLAFDDSLAIWMGRHEPEVQQALLDLLAPGQVAYDIGAHIGYMALLMAEAVGAGGRVVAYEPDPDNLELLERNIDLNDLRQRVVVRRVAVGAAAGKASVVKHGASPMSGIDVGEGDTDVTTLDAEVFDQGMPAPDLLLMDTEGMEGAILAGADRVIEAYRPTLVLEHHGKAAELTAQLAGRYPPPTAIDGDHLLFRR